MGNGVPLGTTVEETTVGNTPHSTGVQRSETVVGTYEVLRDTPGCPVRVVSPVYCLKVF